MIDGFIINNQKAVMTLGQFINRNRRILCIMFFQIQSEMFTDFFRKDRSRNPRGAFGKLYEHAVINVVINQYNGSLGRAKQVINKYIRITSVPILIPQQQLVAEVAAFV